MLFLRKSKAIAPVRVSLGADAYIDIKPATSFEVDEAAAQVRLALAGLIIGSESAAALVPVLGDEFALADGAFDKVKIEAAHERLVGIYLVMACQRGWAGIGLDETREAVSEPEIGSVALLLSDPGRRQLIMNAINKAVHVEAAEGNGLPVSLHGGAGIPDGAPIAALATNPAPMDAASATRTVN